MPEERQDEDGDEVEKKIKSGGRGEGRRGGEEVFFINL